MDSEKALEPTKPVPVKTQRGAAVLNDDLSVKTHYDRAVAEGYEVRFEHPKDGEVVLTYWK